MDGQADQGPSALVKNTKKPQPKRKSNASVGTGKAIKVRRHGRIGKLAELRNLPLDVLFEIFGHLLPLDLLHMARTTKEFRRVLLSRSTKWVWIAARGNIPGFPDCPSYLTEPQYANLAFDPHCHICLAPNVRNVEWLFRNRVCAKCAKTQLDDAYPNDYSLLDDIFVNFDALVPCRPGKRRYRDLLFVDEKLAVKRHYESLPDSNAQEAYVQERKALVREIEDHAKLCQQWASNHAKDRSNEIADAKASRERSIVAKLVALGWGEEIESIPYDDRLSTHKLVKQPVLLTDRIWKNIEAPLVSYMQEMRANRLTRERAALILERKGIAIGVLRKYKNARLPQSEPLPESADFCAWEKVQDILTLPSEMSVEESNFDDIAQTLPIWIGAWRTRIDKMLAKKIRHERYGMQLSDEEAIAEMKLATTIFKCSRCDPSFDFTAYYDFDLLHPGRRPLFYPQCLSHKCLTRVDACHLMSNDHKDPSVMLPGYDEFRNKWCAHLDVDRSLKSEVESVVLAFGMDPKLARSEDMDSSGNALACLTCAEWDVDGDVDGDDMATVSVFRWRDAVRHAAEYHRHKTVSWHLFPIDEASDLLEDFDYMRVWSCAHCRDGPNERLFSTLDYVITHVLAAHKVEDPELDKDFFKTFDACQNYSNFPPPGMFHFINIRLQRPEDLLDTDV